MGLARIKKRLLTKLVIGLFLLIIFCFSLFAAEYLAYDEKISKIHPFLGFVDSLPEVLDVFYKPITIFRKSKLPLYQLVIDPQDLKKLEDNLPPRGSFMTDEYRKRVPAKFIYNNKTYDVKVGFRGARFDHWIFEKKSWRIIFPESDYLNGLSAINLMVPLTREFISEEVNHFRAKKLGLTVPDSQYIQLKVNNKYFGAYWQVEQWNKGFLERHDLVADANLYTDWNPDWSDLFYFTSDWEKYTEDKVSPVNNFAELDLLVDLFSQADDQEFWQKIPWVLDLDNFYRWHTLNTMAGASHADSGHNIRLYFNNVIGKFQFFPSDTSQGLEPSVDVSYNVLANRILKNPEFLHQRNKVLFDYVNNDENLEEDLAYFDELYQKAKLAFYKDKAKKYSNFFFNKKIKNRRKMFAIQYHQIQDAFQDDGRQAVTFDVTANQTPANQIASFEIMVQAFSDFKLTKLTAEPKDEVKNLLNRAKFDIYYDLNSNQLFDRNDLKLGQLNFNSETNKLESSFLEPTVYSNLYTARTFSNPSLPVYPLGEPVELIQTNHQFFLISGQRGLPPANLIFQKAKFRLTNTLTGEIVKPERVYVDATTFDYLDQVNYGWQTFINQNPIFRKGVGNEIILPVGSYNINKTIIIPKGFSLKIMAAARLNFAPDVSLISYSPITAIGTQQNPIVFTGQDKNRPWGVVGVVNTGKSTFKNVKFESGGEAYINGIVFSGMLALHQTDGEISNSQINQAFGDDGINIKYGQALIQDNYFYNNSLDALDLDWSDSQVLNNTFINNGNDGIDISGSQAIIKNNLVEKSGDKGISIGEKSDPLIFNNVLTGGNTGIAVKDSSAPQIINNVIYQNNEGISIFEKKPIFGGATAKVFNTIIWGNKEQIKLDDKSSIEVQYSDIENGWPGQGNVEIEPQLLTNYLLPEVSELSDLGNSEILKDIIEQYLLQTPIGLIKELWPR